MSLATYKKKRSFDKTTEPSGDKVGNRRRVSRSKSTGGKSKSGSRRPSGELIFVIQKHDATRLHYDFRLEMEGVLKSWAVPKGPSTDPSVRRLAMMVEDHPYDYKDFEGVIPKGQYGGGTVIVWDYGTYTPIEPVKNKAEAEKLLLKQLKAGSLKVHLYGKKLKGEYALVRTRGNAGDNAWLLIKHRDKYASETDITLKDKSAVSGKTIEKMEAKPDRVYGRKTIDPGTKVKATATRSAKTAVTGSAKKSAKGPGVKSKAGSSDPAGAGDLAGTPKASFPKTVDPMLATLVDEPVEGPGWLYEIKWDGYRAIAFCNKNKLELVSRNHKSFNEKFYAVYNAVKALGLQAVLDGEIAVLNNAGVSRFGALQNWRSEADGDLVYYVFDLLWLNGHDLQGLPLTRRRELLQSLLPEEGAVRLSETYDTTAAEFLQAAGKMGLEGIIAKKADSEYHQGDRGGDWLKIKVHKRHEVVIGGFTKNDDSPKAFSALLVGVYEGQRLHYTGKIGTGFSDKIQKEMMAKFKPLITKTLPFMELPDVNKPSRFRPNPPHASATWLKPKLVCEVSYSEMTEDGVMRHPSFEGLRIDKDAKDVHAEVAHPTPPTQKKSSAKKSTAKKTAARNSTAEKSTAKKTSTKKSSMITLKPVTAAQRGQTLLNPTEESQVKKVNGHELKFNNLSKVFWPREGYTKRDLLNYYYQAAPYILPYLKDRPQSLNRFPNGIEGKSFYQKDVTDTAPEWVKQFPYHTGAGEDKNFLVVEEAASLLWMANLGAIEMNPWNSTIHHPDNPDWCIIDLDPSEKNTFEQVIKTAIVVRKILEGLGVKGYPKTSGSTGIHIYIPMGAKYTYDECQLFGKLIATHVHDQLPDFTSIERMTNKRRGKLYIDYLQNRSNATLAAPYSVRPKPGATVSMPLHWEEVKKGLKMADFTMKNALARVKAEGDLFKPVLGKGIDLKKMLAKIQTI